MENLHTVEMKQIATCILDIYCILTAFKITLSSSEKWAEHLRKTDGMLQGQQWQDDTERQQVPTGDEIRYHPFLLSRIDWTPWKKTPYWMHNMYRCHEVRFFLVLTFPYGESHAVGFYGSLPCNGPLIKTTFWNVIGHLSFGKFCWWWCKVSAFWLRSFV